MARFTPTMHTVRLDAITNGGQTIGTLESGKKCFVWGGLPGEKVTFISTKKKSHLVEGIVTEVIEPSSERIDSRDPNSYLSTSPWQIMTTQAELKYKRQLIHDAFRLHNVDLDEEQPVYSDGIEYGYRNKLEFSWYGDTDASTGAETLDLAFFRRGGKGKIVVEGSTLAREEINQVARLVRDSLRAQSISARQLKTLLIRANQHGETTWQLYVKDHEPAGKSSWQEVLNATEQMLKDSGCIGGEVIYSDPRSPASVITEPLQAFGTSTLSDTVHEVGFRYACEGFFQINIPVYEQVLGDIASWTDSPDGSSVNGVVDLYSGVGTIGLTVGGKNCTLVELNPSAVREMKRNITEQNSSAVAVLAASENALEYIVSDKIIIVDPPRAGLHRDVVDRLLEAMPPRIVYLSCNPVTQARDTALLLEAYKIVHTKGYNFFPRTPHIEHLVVLEPR